MLMKPLRTPPVPENERPRIPLPDKMPDDVTLIGAWGDIFGAIGNTHYLLSKFSQKTVGAIYYGYDEHLREFLIAQSCFSRVRHIVPKSREEYLRVVGVACQQRSDINMWLTDMVGPLASQYKNVWPVHIDFHCIDGAQCERFYAAKLPERATRWAEEFRTDKPTYLVNPYSTQSATLDQHWPHWAEAVKHLNADTDSRYLLVGQEMGQLEKWVPIGGNMIDFRRRTSTMMHVLALTRICQGVISTSNVLSMWSIIDDIKSLICCNSVLVSENNYFKRWITAPSNTLLRQSSSFDQFIRTLQEWKK